MAEKDASLALSTAAPLVERQAKRDHVPAPAGNMTVVYWHRELPPLDAEVMGEHTIEATSGRVPGTIAHRDDLWQGCYADLMAQARMRLEQEVTRLGGHYAHVLDEAIDTRRDDAKDEAWLRGRFEYVLYRRPSTEAAPHPTPTLA